jgi:hypothetical protein
LSLVAFKYPGLCVEIQPSGEENTAYVAEDRRSSAPGAIGALATRPDPYWSGLLHPRTILQLISEITKPPGAQLIVVFPPNLHSNHHAL